MKKITCFIFLNIICAAIFAVDVRQVMFGNNYETIEEINDASFFEEYPDIKSYVEKIDFYDFKIIKHDDTNYYRVFEQIIGDKKFIRVVRGVKPLTDDYIKQWRNPDKMSSHEQHTYFVQLFYLPENEDPVAILPISRMEADGYAWENGTDNKYEMIEIIQRNGNVKGFMHVRLEDRIDHHNRAEESREPTEKYINTAEYYLFDDVINGATEKKGGICFVKSYYNFPCLDIHTGQTLVDSKRPFMYTVNNVFDGNKGTSYVENTKDDLIFISLYKKEYKNIKKIKILNGFSLNSDLYKNNSRIKKLGDYYISSESIDESKDFYSNKTIDVEDLFSKYQILEWDDTILAVTEIYKGNKYADTCISELDFYDESYGWIFGE